MQPPGKTQTFVAFCVDDFNMILFQLRLHKPGIYDVCDNVLHPPCFMAHTCGQLLPVCS